ncbi:hypothetical protein [Immundisolibacter sp.]|uniref:hypothetical protein n=1 Tax=Immundisolibacter sp. TaxID=1934948 RepID=UPI0035659080
MYIWRGILLLLVCNGLVACAPSVPLQRAQINSISRDSTPADLDRVLANATIIAQYEFVENEQAYFARHYSLHTGSRQEMSMVCTPTCIPIFVPVSITTDYVVIQRMPSKAIHAWGTLEELSKDPDSEVSSIMPVVKRLLEDARKKK